MSKRTTPTLATLCLGLAAAATAGIWMYYSPARWTSDATIEAPLRVGPGKGDPSRAGRHLGFDTYAYPGDKLMLAWRHTDVPYEWVGYYLPAPCHKGRTWVGKRERLVAMGWGMAVIYVGQQTWDKMPSEFETIWNWAPRTRQVATRVKKTVKRNGASTTKWVAGTKTVKDSVRVPTRVKVDPLSRPLDRCESNLVSGARGTLEADDAIRRTEAEGFPTGTVIFLDIERMHSTPHPMREYYRAWTARVLSDGRYRPGFYAHKRNVDVIYEDVKAEYVALGRVEEPPFWIAGGRDFSADRAPHEVGHSFAAVWQGVLDVVEVWMGFSLPLDVNVSHVPDPSHQFIRTE